MPCNVCTKEPCSCEVDKIISELISNAGMSVKPDITLEEIRKAIESMLTELTLLKTAIATLIQVSTSHESRLSTLESAVTASGKTAMLYYDWVLRLLDHTGLKPTLKKKEDSQEPPKADIVTTQSYEAGQSEPHPNMYG